MKRMYSIEAIRRQVCREFGLKQSELLGMSKKGLLGEARPLYCYLLYKRYSRNKTIIAKAMNRKSHSGAIDFLKRAKSLLKTDELLKSRKKSIMNRLKHFE